MKGVIDRQQIKKAESIETLLFYCGRDYLKILKLDIMNILIICTFNYLYLSGLSIITVC
jgi:hypothetical protein